MTASSGMFREETRPKGRASQAGVGSNAVKQACTLKAQDSPCHHPPSLPSTHTHTCEHLHAQAAVLIHTLVLGRGAAHGLWLNVF